MAKVEAARAMATGLIFAFDGGSLDAPGRLPLFESREEMKAMVRRAAAITDAPRMRRERLEARLSADQKRLFQRAAELQGRTLTDFLIASAQEAAFRTIEDTRSIELTADESQAFAEALINPREPAPRLKAAARRFLATIDY